MVVNLEQPDEYDSETVKAQALANVQSAFIKHEEKVCPFSTICLAKSYLMTKESYEKEGGVKYLTQKLEETRRKVEWVFGYKGIGWGWGMIYSITIYDEGVVGEADDTVLFSCSTRNMLV